MVEKETKSDTVMQSMVVPVDRGWHERVKEKSKLYGMKGKESGLLLRMGLRKFSLFADLHRPRIPLKYPQFI